MNNLNLHHMVLLVLLYANLCIQISQKCKFKIYSCRMKFSVEKLVQGSCRLGVLSEIVKKHGMVETPFCLLYTRGGK
jgi:hypothetical protein